MYQSIIKVYQSGTTAGSLPLLTTPQTRAKRGVVCGWSSQSIRSQKQMLYSVRVCDLFGLGFAFTFTLRDCPESRSEFETLRTKLIKRFRRLGLIRLHWLIEWQARGIPHLHGCVWFPEAIPCSYLEDQWLRVAEPYGALSLGQDVKQLEDVKGWLQYLAKHAARGLYHYQRSNENIPSGWYKTGRMWGRVGDWPIDQPMKFQVHKRGFFAYRRMVKNLQIATVRAREDWKGLAHRRRLLKSPYRGLSELRGVNDWVSVDDSTRLLVWLGSQGYPIIQID